MNKNNKDTRYIRTYEMAKDYKSNPHLKNNLGVSGGIPLMYLVNNPLKYIDPLGLDAFPLEYPYGFLRKSRFIHPGGLSPGLLWHVGKGVPMATWEYLKDVGETAVYIDQKYEFPGMGMMLINAGTSINAIPGLQGFGTPVLLFGLWKLFKTGYTAGTNIGNLYNLNFFEPPEYSPPPGPSSKPAPKNSGGNMHYRRGPLNKLPTPVPHREGAYDHLDIRLPTYPLYWKGTQPPPDKPKQQPPPPDDLPIPLPGPET